MIFQKCIGPDMFLWIGQCMVEVCALQSALRVLSVCVRVFPLQAYLLVFSLLQLRKCLLHTCCFFEGNKCCFDRFNFKGSHHRRHSYVSLGCAVTSVSAGVIKAGITSWRLKQELRKHFHAA